MTHDPAKPIDVQQEESDVEEEEQGTERDRGFPCGNEEDLPNRSTCDKKHSGKPELTKVTMNQDAK